MKRIAIIILLVFVTGTPLVHASTVEKAIYENSGISDAANESQLIESLITDFDFRDLTTEILSGRTFEPDNIILQLLGIIADEVVMNLHIMLTIIVLSVIWGIISNIQSSYSAKAVAETAFFAFYAVFMGLIFKGIKDCAELAETMIADQVLFLKAAVPVYTAMVMSTGNVATATGMEPVFLYFVQLIGALIEKIVLPVMLWVSVLNMVNCITKKFSIKKLIDFTKQIIRWSLGIIMTLFVGILGMTGFTASTTDTLGLKTLRFAVGNFVPVVGGFLSDSVATVLTSMTALKNAIGLAGVITIILICALPVIKMMVMIFIYKLTAGVIEPMSDERITNMISESASTVTFLFSVSLTITIMFILGITIVINTGANLIQ